MTIGLPEVLQQYEQAVDQLQMQQVVIEREGMAAEFLAHLQQEGRQVVTLVPSRQYQGEASFEQVGAWQPWRSNRQGQLICEVAWARFRLPRPNPLDPPVEVVGAVPDDDWCADLVEGQRVFWEDGWQATPAPPAQSVPKLIPVITTGRGAQALELAQTYFHRWA